MNLHPTFPLPCSALLGLSLLCSACVDAEELPLPAEEEEPDFSAPAAADELATPWGDSASASFELSPLGRQVAVVQGCTLGSTVAGWEVQSVFPGATQPALARYKAFECDTCDQDDVDALEDALDSMGCLMAPQYDGPRPDHTNVRAQAADPLTAAAAVPMRDAFYAQLGRVSDTELGSRVPINVTILDSHNRFDNDNPFTRHGRVMRQIAASILCPDPTDSTCYDNVEMRLALPLWPDGQRNVGSGGVAGSATDIATAIYNAVDTWEAGNGERAIFNLSLGYDMEIGVVAPAQLPPAARSLHEAITYARCKGALVIAAAGNGEGCGESGPLVPAAWEEWDAPGFPLCNQLGYMPQLPPSYQVFDGGPLVYAISGVHADGTPLINTRAGSRTKLAAHAFAAVVDEPGGGSQTQQVTGSSVAAAVGSGIASVVWSLKPELSPADVMDHLYQGGEPVGALAEYPVVTGGPQPPIRRLSMCGAVDHACPTGSSCHGTWSCSPLPTAELLDPAFAAIDAASVGAPVHTAALTPPASCDDVCGGTSIARRATGVTCFDVITVEEDRESNPQPTWSVCPTCTLKTSDATAPMSLGEDYANDIVQETMLEVYLSDGTDRRYDLGQPQLTSTSVTIVKIEDSNWPGEEIEKAVLTFLLYDPATGDETQHQGVIPVRQ